MANCRGIVILQSASFKSEEGEDIKYYEVLDVQIEEPWRAVQQLINLAKYLAFVVGKDEVGVSELAIIKDVVLSSMPADRSQALRIVKDQGGNITAKGLTEFSDKSVKTSRRLLDELVALKVLEKVKGSGTVASDYKIFTHFQDFLLLDPTEFMSHKDRGTETPQGVERPEVGIEKLRSLLAQDLKLISDKDLHIYLESAVKWLTDNLNQPLSDEYGLVDSVWDKINEETKRREKEANKYTKHDQRLTNELFNNEEIPIDQSQEGGEQTL